MKHLKSLAATIFAITLTVSFSLNPPAHAMKMLSDSTINEAVRYGLENQEFGLSTFLGSNWLEGADGSLLNIYTPYMEIARSAAHRKMTSKPSNQEVAKARKKCIEDISYVWHHPTVKFMVSVYGDQPNFAKEYFARIEGVGKGRTYTLYPKKNIQQYLADYEKDAKIKPYTAINAYHFKYEDIAPLDEFTFQLYGKGLEPISFKVNNRHIQ